MSTDTVLTDGQIIEAHQTLPPTYHPTQFARAIEQAVLQSPEVVAWKKDAERYRHLRDQGELGPHDVFNAWWLSENGYPQTLDAAIDAAMEKQP